MYRNIGIYSPVIKGDFWFYLLFWVISIHPWKDETKALKSDIKGGGVNISLSLIYLQIQTCLQQLEQNMSADPFMPNHSELSGKCSTSEEGLEWKHDNENQSRQKGPQVLTYCTECPTVMIHVTPESESLQQDNTTLCQNEYQMEMQQKTSRCPQGAWEPQQLNSGEVTVFHPLVHDINPSSGCPVLAQSALDGSLKRFRLLAILLKCHLHVNQSRNTRQESLLEN